MPTSVSTSRIFFMSPPAGNSRGKRRAEAEERSRVFEVGNKTAGVPLSTLIPQASHLKPRFPGSGLGHFCFPLFLPISPNAIPRLFGLLSSKHSAVDPEGIDLAEESERGPRANSTGIRALADLWRRATQAEKKQGA